MNKKEIFKRKLFAVICFLINFNLLAVPFYSLLFLDFSLPQVQTFLATAIAKALQMFGYQVASKGYVLTLFTINEIARVNITVDCLGWKSMYVLSALVLAVTYPLRKKIKFLLVALPAIFLINYLRIVSTLLFVLAYGFRYLDFVHGILWQEGLVAVVVLAWYLWLRQIKYNITQTKLFFR